MDEHLRRIFLLLTFQLAENFEACLLAGAREVAAELPQRMNRERAVQYFRAELVGASVRDVAAQMRDHLARCDGGADCHLCYCRT